MANQFTYANESLNCMSRIDYFITSDLSNTFAFNILDLDANFSDHLLIMVVVLSCNYQNNTGSKSQASL